MLRSTGPHSTSGSSTAPPLGRRLFHLIAGSGIPLAGIFAPQPELAASVAVLALISLGLDLVRFRMAGLNRLFLRWLAPLLKHDEDRKITGASYMLAAALIAFLIFDRQVAVLALLFLALGDPAAALVGSSSAEGR